MKKYGYARVSTMEQNLERQVNNITRLYPDAIIIRDEFTGRGMSRPAWGKLYPKLKKGDLVVFDSVSRMSRSAQEGFEVYQDLYERGVDLIFIKEPCINTESYREALKGTISTDVKSGDKATDDLVSGIVEAINKFMMAKVRQDILRAFEQSQKEVDDLRQRVREGMAETAKHNEELKILYPDNYKDRPDYKQVGRESGDKLHVKKAEPIKALIRKYSRDFDGTLSDPELLAVLSTKTVKIPNRKKSGKVEEKEISAKISRNTLYKYKAQIREEWVARIIPVTVESEKPQTKYAKVEFLETPVAETKTFTVEVTQETAQEERVITLQTVSADGE